MLNEIKSGLAAKLNEVFGADIAVYSEGAEQDFLKPCFFISFLNSSQKKGIGSRYFRKQPVDISYYPSTPNKNEEMHTVADKLYDALEYISMGEELLRGRNISFEIVGGILHVYAEFNMFVIKKTEAEEFMGNAQVNTRYK